MSKEFNSALEHFTNPAAALLHQGMAQQPKKTEAPQPVDIEAEREKIHQEERARIYAEMSRETKSKKLQLLIYPSLYRDIKALADKEGASVNNYINEVLRVHRDSMKDKAEANR